MVTHKENEHQSNVPRKLNSRRLFPFPAVRKFGRLPRFIRRVFKNKKARESSKHLQAQTVDSLSEHLDSQTVNLNNLGQEQSSLSFEQSSHQSVYHSDTPLLESQEHPQQTVTPANDYSKQTTNSAKLAGEDRNMTDGKSHVGQAGRVASWAVHFDRLLQDPLGVNIFTKFLEREFSDENMRFWQVCQRFRGLADQRQQQALAHDIYSGHIAEQASDPVNIDNATRSHTEQFLDSPTSAMFDVAQNQIRQLMKLDSYPRFLKSDLYKNMLVEEMRGNIFHEPEQTGQRKHKKKQV
ncbi:unnamed protein product, partial [Candidula unifasciata]